MNNFLIVYHENGIHSKKANISEFYPDFALLIQALLIQS